MRKSSTTGPSEKGAPTGDGSLAGSARPPNGQKGVENGASYATPGEEDILPKKPRSIVILRATIALTFAVTLSLCSALSYTFARGSELNRLSARYEAVVQQLSDSVQLGLDSRAKGALAAAQALAMPPASEAQEYAKNILASYHAVALNVISIVPTESREAFERSAAAAAVTAFGADSPHARRLRSGIRDVTYRFFPNLTLQTNLTAFPRADPAALPPPPEPFAPFFGASTLSISDQAPVPFLTNELNFTHRAAAYYRALSTGGLASTGLTFAAFSYLVSGTPRVCTMLVAPMTWGGQVSGFASLNFAWGELFVNTVQSFCRVEILLRSDNATNLTGMYEAALSAGAVPPDTSLFTLSVEGRGAVDLGWGDLREPMSELKSRFHRTVSVSVGGVPFEIEVTPMEQCLASHLTETPQDLAIGAAFLVVFVAAVAALYDVLSLRYLSRLAREHVRRHGAWARAETARARAEAASAEAKHRFLSTVSHEIRSPLHAISTAAALIPDAGPLNGEQLELLRMVDSGANHVVVIVEDMLALRSLEMGNFQVRLATTDLVHEVIEPAFKMLRMQHNLQDRLQTLRLGWSVAPGASTVVRTDGSRCLQVVGNLLQNAVKFTKDGGRIWLDVSEEEGKEGRRFVQLAVRDSGIGVEPGKQARIFEPFTQADDSANREYQGTGIGLAIGRMIATQLGGSLECASKGLGTGCTFTFRIPVDGAIAAAAAPAAALAPGASASAGSASGSGSGAGEEEHNGGREFIHSALGGSDVVGRLPVRPRAAGAPQVKHAEERPQPQPRQASLPDEEATRPDRHGSGRPPRPPAPSVPHLPHAPLPGDASAGEQRRASAGAAEASSSGAVPQAPPNVLEHVDVASMQLRLANARSGRRSVAAGGVAGSDGRRDTAYLGSSGEGGERCAPAAGSGSGSGGAADTDSALSSSDGGDGGAIRRVLVAEDNRTNRLLMKRVLDKFGLESALAEDGAVAVDVFLREGPWDLILMDINMPVCDGHEATRRIRELIRKGLAPDTPILALSASASDEEIRRCRESGMDGHLAKPLKMEALIKIMGLASVQAPVPEEGGRA